MFILHGDFVFGYILISILAQFSKDMSNFDTKVDWIFGLKLDYLA